MGSHEIWSGFPALLGPPPSWLYLLFQGLRPGWSLRSSMVCPFVARWWGTLMTLYHKVVPRVERLSSFFFLVHIFSSSPLPKVSLNAECTRLKFPLLSLSNEWCSGWDMEDQKQWLRGLGARVFCAWFRGNTASIFGVFIDKSSVIFMMKHLHFWKVLDNTL